LAPIAILIAHLNSPAGADSDVFLAFRSERVKPLKKVYVNTTLTSTNGCNVHIQGWVEFTIIPPKFIGFEGTVTISGPKGCPNGTLNFTRLAGGSEDLLATPDVDDVCTLETLTWSGNNTDFVNILNESSINSLLVAELNNMCNE